MVYSAFLSYSRADEAAGAGLERDLQKYRIPKKFRQVAGRRRFSIFRDVHDAELGEYDDVITKALESSQFLIVLCSPAARASGYVGGEIREFVRIHGKDGVIPVLVDGRPNGEVGPNDALQDQAFPEILYELFEEPIAAEFRTRPGDGYFARQKRRREAFFQIVAKLLGQPKSDELVQRDRRKRLLTAAAGSAALVVMAGVGGWYLYDRMPKPGLDPVWMLTKADHEPRVEAGLARISNALRAELPQRGDPGRLLIATWNIRKFATVRPARTAEPLAYIALVLSHFDIVAVQEMTGDTAQFDTARQKLLSRLGPHWQYAGSGVTEGPRGSNERLGFFFDTRSVQRAGDLDEIVLPQAILENVELTRQIARTPLIAGFRSGDHAITLTNAHIYYGANSGEKRRERLKEFTALVKYLRNALGRGRLFSEHMILLGDLNFDRPDAPEASAAKQQGFSFPADLLAAPSNASRNRPYDQIVLSWDSTAQGPCVGSAGVFDIFAEVYRDEDFDDYAAAIEAERALSNSKPPRDPQRHFTRNWRLNKMSDHFPKWVEIDFDCR